MKSWIRLSVLCSLIGTAGIAHAGTAANVIGFAQSLRAAVPIPAGWDGIFDHTDSVYVCSLGPLGASRDTDTTCVGQEFRVPLEGTFTCTGSSTANTFHIECTGITPFEPGCDINASITYDGVKTAGGYDGAATMTGTDSPPGCVPIPICLTMHVHATRLGDAPQEYCAGVPTLPKTWGSVKANYR